MVALGAAYYGRYLDDELFATRCKQRRKWIVKEDREDLVLQGVSESPSKVEEVQSSYSKQEMMNSEVFSTVGFSTNIVTLQQNEPNDSDAFGT